MTNRELLELAAKAAGYKIHVWGEKGRENFARMDQLHAPRWNSLNDDGDAFRLAVKLNLNKLYSAEDAGAGVEIYAEWHDALTNNEIKEVYERDPYAATRRAITRAAAEIGKGISQHVLRDLPEDNYYKTQAEAEIGKSIK